MYVSYIYEIYQLCVYICNIWNIKDIVICTLYIVQ